MTKRRPPSGSAQVQRATLAPSRRDQMKEAAANYANRKPVPSVAFGS